MKKISTILIAAAAMFGSEAMAQLDLNDPKFAVWGETVEERRQNMLTSSFLKEACDNKNYNQGSAYFKELIEKCPAATMNTYVNGTKLFKSKIARAKSVAEKEALVDSLLLCYDLRNQYFGNHSKYGSAYILDRKAREVLNYLPSDRAAIRKAFREAIEAGGDNTDPETVVAYFSNLCDDYKNTDEVVADEVIAEYDRLTPFFTQNPEGAEFKKQFDASFGLSGVASCENLEKLFSERLAAAPDDESVLSQAVALMSRAGCDSEFYFEVAEKYYVVKPQTETALFLAKAFQGKGDFAKATDYLREALKGRDRRSVRARICLCSWVWSSWHRAMSPPPAT